MKEEYSKGIYLQALSIDERLPALMSAPGWEAGLHSCYDRALNLLDGRGNLIVLAPAGASDGPHRILVELPPGETFRLWPLSKNDCFTCDNRRLSAVEKPVVIDFSSSRLWKEVIPGGSFLSSSVMMRHRDMLLDYLVNSADREDSGFFDALSALLKKDRPRHGAQEGLYAKLLALCEHIIEGIEARHIEDVRNAFSAMMGLGRGLTPSGDDILSGFLSALQVSRRACQERYPDDLCRCLEELIARKNGETTFISSRYLLWSAAGRLSEDMVRLLDELFFVEGKGLGQAITRLASHGASSGREIMLGIACAMTLIINICNQERGDM